jgi:hypothetical protein
MAGAHIKEAAAPTRMVLRVIRASMSGMISLVLKMYE